MNANKFLDAQPLKRINIPKVLYTCYQLSNLSLPEKQSTYFLALLLAVDIVNCMDS